MKFAKYFLILFVLIVIGLPSVNAYDPNKVLSKGVKVRLCPIECALEYEECYSEYPDSKSCIMQFRTCIESCHIRNTKIKG